MHRVYIAWSHDFLSHIRKENKNLYVFKIGRHSIHTDRIDRLNNGWKVRGGRGPSLAAQKDWRLNELWCGEASKAEYRESEMHEFLKVFPSYSAYVQDIAHNDMKMSKYDKWESNGFREIHAIDSDDILRHIDLIHCNPKKYILESMIDAIFNLSIELDKEYKLRALK